MPAITKRKAGAVTRSRRSRRGHGCRRVTKAELKRVVAHIVATTPPTRLFELYYWTQEQSLLKLLRRLASLAPTSRNAMDSFFQFAANGAVTARLGPKGQLILEARHTNEAASAFQYILDEEDLTVRPPKPH